MTKPRIQIEKLLFSGRDVPPAELYFPSHFTFIYGASNTGKSFAVKALDYMLGGNRELPDIVERRAYETVALDVILNGADHVRLERAISGASLRLLQEGADPRVLANKHNKDSDDNLSNYLLQKLGFAGSEIAREKAGTKKPLSFRDVARFCITDEIPIQSERSPVESGDHQAAPLERNVFKFLITGVDDSALITQQKPKDFRTGKVAQVSILAELIAQLDQQIASKFPDPDGLDDQASKVEDSLKAIEADIVSARSSARAMLDSKRAIAQRIADDQQRATEILFSLENFEQLQAVYESDIERLETLEEAGFLLSLDAKKPCPICGAPAESQSHEHGLFSVETVRAAAEREIAKIRAHKVELAATVAATKSEFAATSDRLLADRKELESVEASLLASVPDSEEMQRRFAEIIPLRDHIRLGLDLISRRSALENQRLRIERSKPVRPSSNFLGGLSTQTAQEFADVVADVLTKWDFPGDRRVTFEMDTHDLIIDGKRRRDNGKGVRSITHAAFKVALLLYCRERNLPHPGFLVLDTPLVTYRDPMSSREGALAPDEEIIRRNTDLRRSFFEHLGSIQDAQFIVFDNIDPPEHGDEFAAVEAFTNDPLEGRQGLLGRPRPRVAVA